MDPLPLHVRCESPPCGPRLVLPWQGQVGVFRAQPPALDLLALVPAEQVVRARLCRSGCHLLIQDHGGQRVRLFTVRAGEPPSQVAVPPLPTGDFFDLLMAGGHVVLAGRTRAGPMLWCWEHGWLETGWRAFPMPSLEAPGGKAVDFVFWRDGDVFGRGGDVIAVDDMVLPRWCLVFALDRAGWATHLSTVLIPAHTTYETVTHASLGHRYLALLSTGVNHGTTSYHLSVLGADCLRERACYSLELSPGCAGGVLGALPLLRGLAFAGDVLFGLCGDRSLLRLDLRGPQLPVGRGRVHGIGDSRVGSGPPPALEDVPGLEQAYGLAALDARGVYVAGFDSHGSERSVWIPVEPS